jgi:OmpA family
LLKRSIRAGWIAALALLSGCVTPPPPQPEPRSYSGVLRYWFEGQTFTQDGRSDAWAMGVTGNAGRKLGAVLPEGFAPPPFGYAIHAEIVGVVRPANPDAGRYGPIGNYAYYVTITDVISAQLVPIACPEVDVVVYFDPGSADLSASATAQIEDAAANLHRQACNVTDIQITAATDTRGAAADNQVLSDRRAAAVAALVAARGFAADLIHAEGRGETDLQRPTPDGVAEPLNNRARLVVRSPAAAAP